MLLPLTHCNAVLKLIAPNQSSTCLGDEVMNVCICAQSRPSSSSSANVGGCLRFQTATGAISPSLSHHHHRLNNAGQCSPTEPSRWPTRTREKSHHRQLAPSLASSPRLLQTSPLVEGDPHLRSHHRHPHGVFEKGTLKIRVESMTLNSRSTVLVHTVLLTRHSAATVVRCEAEGLASMADVAGLLNCPVHRRINQS